jgi:hypothetical protein
VKFIFEGRVQVLLATPKLKSTRVQAWLFMDIYIISIISLIMDEILMLKC